MLNRWYKSNTTNKFEELVAQGLNAGTLTQDEYITWAKKRGLM